MQYFEDIEVGSTARFGDYAVTRDEVVAFAEKYDPQPFHLSDEAAKQLLLLEKHLRDPKTGLLYHGWDEKHVQAWAKKHHSLWYEKVTREKK